MLESVPPLDPEDDPELDPDAAPSVPEPVNDDPESPLAPAPPPEEEQPPSAIAAASQGIHDRERTALTVSWPLLRPLLLDCILGSFEWVRSGHRESHERFAFDAHIGPG
jgi:hypothetical protein